MTEFDDFDADSKSLLVGLLAAAMSGAIVGASILGTILFLIGRM